MAVIAHHRLCARHASEWIPDENDRVCIFVESLVCDGELVEYVPADQLRGAVEALREIKRVAAIEAPPVSEEVPANVWKIAFDALNHLGGQ
jgi:hypothetical protein